MNKNGVTSFCSCEVGELIPVELVGTMVGGYLNSRRVHLGGFGLLHYASKQPGGYPFYDLTDCGPQISQMVSDEGIKSPLRITQRTLKGIRRQAQLLARIGAIH